VFRLGKEGLSRKEGPSEFIFQHFCEPGEKSLGSSTKNEGGGTSI